MESINDRLKEYAPVAARATNRFLSTRGAVLGFVERQDIEAAAMAGVWEGLREFKPGSGALEDFLFVRATYRIIDYVRAALPLSRRDAGELRRHGYITNEQGDKINPLNTMSLDAAVSSNGRSNDNNRSTFKDNLPDAHATSAEEQMLLDEDYEDVMMAVSRLSEREGFVIYMHFWEEQPNRVIAEMLGVTESRVSQLYTRACQRMKFWITHDRRMKAIRPAA